MTPEKRIVMLEHVIDGLEKGIESLYSEVRYAYNVAQSSHFIMDDDRAHNMKTPQNQDDFIYENLHIIQQNLGIALLNLQDIHKHCHLKDSNVTTLEIPPLALVPTHKAKT